MAQEWPIIAGQSALYVENQLMGFKNGARYHPLMANVVKNLDLRNEGAGGLLHPGYQSRLRLQ